MQLTLEVRLDDGVSARTRDFRKVVQRDYPGVPRGDDVVDFGDRGRTMARRVSEAIFLESGEVIVRTLSTNLDNDPEPQVNALLELGYCEI